MKREDKAILINSIKEQIDSTAHFYLADIAGLDATDTSALRRACFKENIKLQVVKNTLLRRALEESDKDTEELYDVLNDNTSIMFTEVGNAPAKLIKKFRKKYKKPILKAAYVEEACYIGDDQLDYLTNVKSKDELVADIVALLQSPAKNVISSLQSGGKILTGVLETLSNKE